MPTTPFLPLPDGLDITAISVREEGLSVYVTSNRALGSFYLALLLFGMECCSIS